MTESNPQPSSRASVLMPALVETAFDYLVPAGTMEGALVEATLAGRKLVGAVWGAPTHDVAVRSVSEPRAAGASPPSIKAIPLSKLKPITGVIDTVPPLKREFRAWLDWISEFTLAPKGAVLSLCGLAHAVKVTKKKQPPQQFSITLPTLTSEQQKITDALLEMTEGNFENGTKTAAERKIAPILLDGVTGSGKTEIYYHALAKALGQHRQVLVLLPEISLTHQWLERFEKTFGTTPVMWHSRMTPAAKARAWQAVANGDVQVVVGARSALFLPFKTLGLIIVDEEHDPSYKQEDGVLYHARDMAVARAQFEGVPIILASATPSLETMENVREGKYQALHLTARYGSAGLPEVKLVDLRLDPPERGDFISPTVKKAMLETLSRGEQVLFFLNRRGYAPLLLCRGCGHRFQCADCSAWLVVHGKKVSSLQSPVSGRSLHCHHCGHREKFPDHCPACNADAEKLAPCGPGVERIAEEVKAMFASDVSACAVIPSPAGGRLGWGGDTADSLRQRKGHPLEKTLVHARELRQQMTEAEKRLWQALRGEALTIKFRKQHPIGNYIADFASYAPKLIVELDGGQHNTPEVEAYDQARSEFLKSQGFTVVRFWNNDVMENIEGVVARIKDTARQISPHPNLPPAGEGTTMPVSLSLDIHHPSISADKPPTLVTLSSDESIPSETWAQIEAGEIDILVGTQMVAKGHHFPRLTLVVVVDADVGLDGADLRAGERTYQMLHQLGGRAGRGELPGTVLVQTYLPEHPVMKALVAHDRNRLMALEAKERKAGGWPPFGQLAAILLDGKDEATVRAAGQMLARTAPEDARLKVLGPAPAPLSKLRGQYRYRLLVKAAPGIHLQRTLRGWLAHQKFKAVRVKVDVNPYYFL